MYPALADVKCIVVHKYQGEENEIILLSLVRSNKEAKIGFLKTENRVCVALSRARKGLYIVGNMDNLCESGGELWQEIKKTLQEGEAIGELRFEISRRCRKGTYSRFYNVLSPCRTGNEVVLRETRLVYDGVECERFRQG